MELSREFYKKLSNTNPISPNVFCADPTGIEYNGRLYVYGTNDHQQYEAGGAEGKNTYEAIKSIVCFSTEDMVNWTYHGCIDVGTIASWVYASWAPSICSRVEEDGLTHFYLYFSNSGSGVGVITATDPLGPWSSPLDEALISQKTPGVENVPNPFDPGVVIDDKGDGYLAFGGGNLGDDAMPGTVRIVKLGKDMISVEGSAVEIKAPYFFEASELNFINGNYIYTFNSSWVERKVWDFSVEKSTQCSMNYMVTKTPLISDSWRYCGNYFKNPGDQGLNYSNNHTHFVDFKGQYYLLYHTLTLQEDMPTNGGFRSICVDKLSVYCDGDGVQIDMCNGTRSGVAAVGCADPFKGISGASMVTEAGVWFDGREICSEMGARSLCSGGWMLVKGVDFGEGADFFAAVVRGKGEIEIRLDKAGNRASAVISVDSPDYAENCVPFVGDVCGVHDVFIIFGQSDLCLKKWKVK